MVAVHLDVVADGNVVAAETTKISGGLDADETNQMARIMGWVVKKLKDTKTMCTKDTEVNNVVLV